MLLWILRLLLCIAGVLLCTIAFNLLKNKKKKAMAEVLAGGKGEIGEKILIDTLDSVLSHLKIPHTTHLQAGYPCAVLPPGARKNSISQEIDVLLVCVYGVVVFEVKHWLGDIALAGDGQLRVSKGKNLAFVQHRPDPLPKTLRKLERLHKQLESQWQSNGHLASQTAGIAQTCQWHAKITITEESATLNSNLPADYLHIEHLQKFFVQMQKDSQPLSKKQFRLLKSGVFGQLDSQKNAKHAHLMRLSPTTTHLKDYQTQTLLLDANRRGGWRYIGLGLLCWLLAYWMH